MFYTFWFTKHCLLHHPEQKPGMVLVYPLSKQGNKDSEQWGACFRPHCECWSPWVWLPGWPSSPHPPVTARFSGKGGAAAQPGASGRAVPRSWRAGRAADDGREAPIPASSFTLTLRQAPQPADSWLTPSTLSSSTSKKWTQRQPAGAPQAEFSPHVWVS